MASGLALIVDSPLLAARALAMGVVDSRLYVVVAARDGRVDDDEDEDVDDGTATTAATRANEKRLVIDVGPTNEVPLGLLPVLATPGRYQAIRVTGTRADASTKAFRFREWLRPLELAPPATPMFLRLPPAAVSLSTIFPLGRTALTTAVSCAEQPCAHLRAAQGLDSLSLAYGFPDLPLVPVFPSVDALATALVADARTPALPACLRRVRAPDASVSVRAWVRQWHMPMDAAWWLTAWYGLPVATTTTGHALCDFFERLAWLPTEWRHGVWALLPARARGSAIAAVGRTLANTLGARFRDLRQVSLTFNCWAALGGADGGEPVADAAGSFAVIDHGMSRVRPLPGTGGSREQKMRTEVTLCSPTPWDDLAADASAATADASNRPRITAVHQTTVAQELGAFDRDRVHAAGLDDYGIPVAREHPTASIVLTTVPPRYAAGGAPYFQVVHPALSDSKAASVPDAPRASVKMPNGVFLARAWPAGGDPTATRAFGELVNQARVWTHVVLLGAHRLVPSTWRALCDLVARMRVLNRLRPSVDGTLVLVGCPAFEYADATHGPLARRLLLSTTVAAAAMPMGAGDLSDLVSPPSEDTCRLIRDVLARAEQEGRLVVAGAAVATRRRPVATGDAGLIGRQQQHLLAATERPRLLANADECRLAAASSIAMCTPHAHYLRWRLMEAQTPQSGLLAMHPRPLLSPALLLDLWAPPLPSASATRRRALPLSLHRGMLWSMTRDEILFLVLYIAEAAAATAPGQPGAIVQLVDKDNSSGSTPLAENMIKALGAPMRRPTRYWTAQDRD